MDCILCSAPIDASNDSGEHVILNALGGRLVVWGILCNSCNPETGSDWDSELAKQLHPLCLLLQIKRQRGEVPPREFEAIGGPPVHMNSDGSLRLIPQREERKLADGTTQIRIIAETIEDGKKAVEKLKRRRYPGIDVNAAIAAATVEKHTPLLKFSQTVGGPLAGRSLVKSALCFAASKGVNARACQDAIRYLTDSDGEPCFGFFYDRDLLQNRPAIPLHCVAVSSRGNHGQLLAYVEYFGAHRAVIRLSEHFSGPDVHDAYAINPMTGERLALEFHIGMSPADIEACYSYKCIPAGSMEAAAHTAMSAAVQLGRQRALLQISEEAIRYAFANCGAREGEQLTLEHVRKLSALYVERILPLFKRQTAPRPASA